MKLQAISHIMKAIKLDSRDTWNDRLSGCLRSTDKTKPYKTCIFPEFSEKNSPEERLINFNALEETTQRLMRSLKICIEKYWLGSLQVQAPQCYVE